METWRKLVTESITCYGESFSDIVGEAWKPINNESRSSTFDQVMDRKFDAGYGSAEGDYFTIWTKNRVYFPCEYDGSEYVGSVSRNPDFVATKHI